MASARGVETTAVGAVVAGGGIALGLVFLGLHSVDLTRALTACVALVRFVAQRGLLRLPEFAQSAAGASVAAPIVLAWYGIGEVLLRRWGPQGDGDGGADILSVARAIAYGAGIWSLLWFGLGIAGLYTTAVAMIALAAGALLGAFALARRGPALLRVVGCERRAGLAEAVAGGVIVLAVAAALTAALAPPTAKDSLTYHVALPKAFAAAGALIADPNNMPSYFPLGVEMHGLSAMLAGRALGARVGEAAFGATVFAFFPLLLAVVYGWARRARLDRAWSLVAVALIASVPTVYDVAASGYVDLALAVYVALGVEAATRWWVVADRGHLRDVALAMGFALAVKLLAVFPLLIVALIVLARVLVGHDGVARGGAAGYAVAALAGAVTLGAPWFARTWASTGSPAFPFLMDVWPAHVEGWDSRRSLLWQTLTAQYGPADPLWRLLTPVVVSLAGAREVAQAYEGALGPGFLVGIALVVWAWRRGRLRTELAVAAAASLALAVCWAFSSQLLRYMLPALAPLAVASAGAAASLAQAGLRGLPVGVMAPAAASLALTLSWFVGDAPMLPVLGAEARAEYLSRRLDYYPYYRLVNETLPADARVWLVDMRRDTYHLERPYFSDYFFEDYTLRSWMDQARTADELWARARAAGISHVLVRHDVLLDYNRSVLVDDARPRDENLARLRLARSFLTEGTRVIRADGKFLLAELPAAR